MTKQVAALDAASMVATDQAASLPDERSDVAAIEAVASGTFAGEGPMSNRYPASATAKKC